MANFRRTLATASAVSILLLGPVVLAFWLPWTYAGPGWFAADLRHYLTGFTASLTSVSLFTPQELLHLADVRRLVVIGTILVLTSVIALAGLPRSELQRALRRGAKIAAAVAAMLLILGSFASDFLIVAFHRLLFRNDYWLLDPSDLLIRLYPPEFWTAVGAGCLIATIVVSIVTIEVSKSKVHPQSPRNNYQLPNSNDQ